MRLPLSPVLGSAELDVHEEMLSSAWDPLLRDEAAILEREIRVAYQIDDAIQQFRLEVWKRHRGGGKTKHPN